MRESVPTGETLQERLFRDSDNKKDMVTVPIAAAWTRHIMIAE
jgi:hypothetical protein